MDKYEGPGYPTIMKWMPYNGYVPLWNCYVPLWEKSPPGYPAPFAPFWEPTVKHVIHQETSLLETSSLGPSLSSTWMCIPRTWRWVCVCGVVMWCNLCMYIMTYCVLCYTSIVICYGILCNIMLCCVILGYNMICYDTLGYVMLSYDTIWHLMLYWVVLCYMLLYYVIVCISYHVMPYYDVYIYIYSSMSFGLIFKGIIFRNELG